MSEGSSFFDLIRRARAGEEEAVAELVRHYEPYIRRAAHIRLRDIRLRRLLDSTDIVQSVLKKLSSRPWTGSSWPARSSW